MAGPDAPAQRQEPRPLRPYSNPHPAWRRVTADETVSVGPCWYGGVTIRATAAGAADVGVYDGLDTGGRQFMTYTVPVSETRPFPEDPPIYFDRGLFIDVGSNVDSVLVRFKPISERAPPPETPPPVE